MTDAILQSSSMPSIMSQYKPLTTKVYDPLFPHSHMVDQVDVMTTDRNRINILPSYAPGVTQMVQLPFGFYNSEAYIEFNLGATGAGTYANFVGLLMAKRIVVRQAETLQEFDYRPVMQWVLSNMTDEKKNLMLLAAGGATPGAGQYIVPLPLFFSHMILGNDDAAPIPSFALASPLVIEITWATQAEVLAAGGAAGATFVTAMNLVTVQRKSTAELRRAHEAMIAAGKWKQPFIDFQTHPAVAVATGTETTMDLNDFEGMLSFLQIQPRLTTDVTTAHTPFVLKSLDSTKMLVEGSEFDKRLTPIESLYESMFNNFRPGLCAISGLGSTDPLTISFGGSKVEEEHTYAGGLNTKAISSLQLVVTHSLGAGATLDILAGKYAIWTLDSAGFLHRFK